VFSYIVRWYKYFFCNTSLNFCIRFMKNIYVIYDVINLLMWFLAILRCSFSCLCYCRLDIAWNCYLGSHLVQLFIWGLTCSHSTIKYLFQLNHYSFECMIFSPLMQSPVKLNLLDKCLLAKYLLYDQLSLFPSKMTLRSVDCRNIIFWRALGFYF
jgi:hypothetical protein